MTGSKPGASVSEVPSQSCPSPPVLFKNTELRARRQSGGSLTQPGKKHSSSSLKQSSSTSKKTNAKSHRKEYLAISNNDPLSESGSEKEEVSITNNISEIFHNKRDSQIAENYPARSELSSKGSSKKKFPGPSSSPNCDLDICDKTGDYDHCMPTLQSFSGKYLLFIAGSIKYFIKYLLLTIMTITINYFIKYFYQKTWRWRACL